jgi:hypothetical protein
MVTICTTILNFTELCAITHGVYFVSFVRISEQTAIISLYSVRRLVFVTETESVYCAVRTGLLTVDLRNRSA